MAQSSGGGSVTNENGTWAVWPLRPSVISIPLEQACLPCPGDAGPGTVQGGSPQRRLEWDTLLGCCGGRPHGKLGVGICTPLPQPQSPKQSRKGCEGRPLFGARFWWHEGIPPCLTRAFSCPPPQPQILPSPVIGSNGPGDDKFFRSQSADTEMTTERERVRKMLSEG